MAYKNPEDQRRACREHYQKYKPMYLAKAAARNKRIGEETRAYVNGIKEASPCADCGIKYPAYVMQFDHIADDKLYNISQLVGRPGYSRECIDREIAKCELVCANCHATRTYKRMHP